MNISLLKKHVWALATLVSASTLNTRAQSTYDPRVLFPALPAFPAGNNYRTATGEPGPDYWQNRSDYVIDVALDDKKNIINGTVTITYTNNSPKALSSLWLQMEQNAFKKDSKGVLSQLFLYKYPTQQTADGGFEIAEVSIGNSKVSNFNVYDTRMELQLNEPLKHGQKVTFSIKYSYHFPTNFKNADFQVNRTDIMPNKDGDVYSVAQWYPRMCVLDDVEGWNTLPYLGNGEFYLDYGDFEVNITVPSAYIVEASGDLQNPEEVLTQVQLQRWKQVQTSDKPVLIRSAKEVSAKDSRPAKTNCTWKYRMNNTRDFAWTASRSFIWEAAGFKLKSGKNVIASSVYPASSLKKDSWARTTEYVRFTIQHFSEMWFDYPYNKAVNVASNLDGMEYPGLVFCSAKDAGNMFWAVVNHELGHTWFPMVVGSNERKYAWMDEGFNLFIDNIATKVFNKGEFKGYEEINGPVTELFGDKMLPLMTRADVIPGDQVYNLQYHKTAYLLALLRERILGAERFDRAFRKYINNWAYKHPTPYDFFRSMNNSTGEDLTWFWQSMFIENFKLDQAVAKVESKNGKSAITISNMNKAAMPLVVEITYVDGSRELHDFPVEIWQFSHSYTFTAQKAGAIKQVTIDPENIYPDINKGNNKWVAR